MFGDGHTRWGRRRGWEPSCDGCVRGLRLCMVMRRLSCPVQAVGDVLEEDTFGELLTDFERHCV